MASNWRTELKNAKKTCIQHGNLRKVHYALADGREMVEEYNTNTGVTTRRAWRIKKKIGGEGDWFIEIGEAELQGSGDTALPIKENSSQPFVTRYVTANNLEWRIRNLVYPVETYSVSVEEDQLTVRTSNKKYFKRLPVPELERLKVSLKQSSIKFAHKYNTLIITYKKPQALIDFEKSVYEDVKMLPVKNEGNMDCKPS